MLAGGTWTETVLYSFAGQNGDGANPYAGVVIGHDGALYGTTAGGGASGQGTVFRLAPPRLPGGAWTETVLYSFSGASDGAFPMAALTVGPGGILYGTTGGGGAANACSSCGTVFELTPPSGSGPWQETVLHSFQGPSSGDGFHPAAGVSIGAGGALYGATELGGTLGWGAVFKLTPPSAGSGDWSEAIIADFNYFNGANPSGGLVSGGAGILYGAALNGGNTACAVTGQLCGTIFRVTR